MHDILETIISVTAWHYGMSWSHAIMILVALGLMYLALGQKKEPFLLLPLSFGILLANLPGANLSAYFTELTPEQIAEGVKTQGPGLLHFIYKGIQPMQGAVPLYPPLIFLCIGAITDFSPLIANPRIALIGLGGQLGIFVAFGLYLLAQKFFLPWCGIEFSGFDFASAACVGIIGSSDGPTSIYTAAQLNPDLLSAVAIAAFSYMGLIPFIQPPIMRLLTNAKERVIVMPEPKQVTQRQRILFPVGLTIVTLLLVPSAGALIGMLMLGNIIRECGIVNRYVDTLSNAALNFLTLLLALSIGSSATADKFLTPQTLLIIVLGLVAFASGTVGGVLVAKLMCHMTGGKVNPLIGNAGVSAMPMAARISQRLGQEYNHQNHLLMHAMGPIVASTIGSGIIAGIFITLLK